MIKEEYIIKFLKLNPLPKVDKKDIIVRLDGRLEWICEHGVGHTIWHPEGYSNSHGCDGCCGNLNWPEVKEK